MRLFAEVYLIIGFVISTMLVLFGGDAYFNDVRTRIVEMCVSKGMDIGIKLWAVKLIYFLMVVFVGPVALVLTLVDTVKGAKKHADNS